MRTPDFDQDTGERSRGAPREPAFNLPPALVAVCALLIVVHLARLALSETLDDDLVWSFGFVPARYDQSVLGDQFPGGLGAKLWSFVTYACLHADWTHLGFNLMWLLPFGSALARRFGTWRFVLFLMIGAIAGAGAHLITHEGEMAPMIGASAAVSAAMAGAIRFAFAHGSFLSFSRGDAEAAARVPAQPLLRALADSRVLGFLGVWFALNIVFGLGAISLGAQAQSIAWEAHIGGFLAGLLLFSLFDPIPPARRDAAPPV